ncbi:MAG: diguanylate cyclase [Cyanobium sp.]
MTRSTSTPSWRHSAPFLRSLVFAFSLAATLILTLCLTAISVLERQRQMINDAEHSSALVETALATSLSDEQRQNLILNHGTTVRELNDEGLNFILVVNQSGQIVFSSRPSWRQLLITDPLLNQLETDDASFRDVVACFRHPHDDCMQLRSLDFVPHLSRFTVVRGVYKPAIDLGMSRQRFLTIVNYDHGILQPSSAIALLLCFVFSLLLSSFLGLFLWILLSAHVVPRLAELAQTDSLTQLMSRGIFMDLAKDTLAEAEERQADLVFAILDIDYFKHINDTYGHGCGDAALRHVAEIFRAVIRTEDLLCRLGGEEFAMLLSMHREHAARALERLRLQLEMSRLHYQGRRLTIQASIGAVATRDCGYNLDYLYSSADQALYSAKGAGRNRIAWSEGRIFSRLST